MVACKCGAAKRQSRFAWRTHMRRATASATYFKLQCCSCANVSCNWAAASAALLC